MRDCFNPVEFPHVPRAPSFWEALYYTHKIYVLYICIYVDTHISIDICTYTRPCSSQESQNEAADWREKAAQPPALGSNAIVYLRLCEARRDVYFLVMEEISTI